MFNQESGEFALTILAEALLDSTMPNDRVAAIPGNFVGCTKCGNTARPVHERDFATNKRRYRCICCVFSMGSMKYIDLAQNPLFPKEFGNILGQVISDLRWGNKSSKALKWYHKTAASPQSGSDALATWNGVPEHTTIHSASSSSNKQGTKRSNIRSAREISEQGQQGKDLEMSDAAGTWQRTSSPVDIDREDSDELAIEMGSYILNDKESWMVSLGIVEILEGFLSICGSVQT